MDIDRLNFPPNLLYILESIAQSRFVALDLELSGVSVRPYGRPDPHRRTHTLQDRYLETKAAAEKYTILQVGFTCVKEEYRSSAGEAGPSQLSYISQPFNVNLSPVIDDRVDVDRDVAYHSGAIDFLNSVGFNFQTPLQWGVPYLSRVEAKLAFDRAKERSERDNQAYSDMHIGDDNADAHKLMQQARSLIAPWTAVDRDATEHLFIGPRRLFQGTDRAKEQDISRYEKRLIHQVVKTEFPHLVSVNKKGGIALMTQDLDREANVKRLRLQEARDRIHRQTGFRWVVEALAGNDLTGIDPKWFTQDPDTGDAKTMDMGSLKSRLQRACHTLRHRPRVIVGHNVYGDLVYLYSTFIGALPDTIEEFQQKVHELFPIVIDTKYLATHGHQNSTQPSSLEQLAEQLQDQQDPRIETDAAHGKYADQAALHEAGFDSKITAELATKLSAKLDAEQRGWDGVMPEPASESKMTDTRPADDVPSPEESAGQGGVSLVVDKLVGLAVNPFHALSDHKDEDCKEDEQTTDSHEDPWAAGRPWKPLERMPDFDDQFWKPYANKLRVYGTQEGVCDLAPSSVSAPVVASTSTAE